MAPRRKIHWKHLIKFPADRVVRPLAAVYLRRECSMRYRGLRIRIMPGVFHPGIFFSTRLLLDYLERLELEGRRFWELGAGSGLISLYAVRRGAQVTASDISRTAVENIRRNARQNGLELDVRQADLFEGMPPQKYDVVVINPPYFRGRPQQEADYAWYCGENFEYFQRLFAGLAPFVRSNSQVLMILSEECDREQIRRIAGRHGWDLHLVFQRRVWWEINFIYRIREKTP